MRSYTRLWWWEHAVKRPLYRAFGFGLAIKAAWFHVAICNLLMGSLNPGVMTQTDDERAMLIGAKWQRDAALALERLHR